MINPKMINDLAIHICPTLTGGGNQCEYRSVILKRLTLWCNSSPTKFDFTAGNLNPITVILILFNNN